MYLEFDHYFWTPERIFCRRKKLPVCGCAQSHMYKVAYVLPLISELLNTCVWCVCVCVCVRACVCVCVCVCVCINCCFNGNEVGHYIAQARRFTVAKQYQSSYVSFYLRITKHNWDLIWLGRRSGHCKLSISAKNVKTWKFWPPL